MSEVKEVASEFIGFKIQNIWPTLKNLTLSPGLTIKRYCNGDHHDLIPPIAYYGVIMFIMYSLQSMSGLSDATDDMYRKTNETIVQSQKKGAGEASPVLEIFSKVSMTLNAINKNEILRTLVYLIPLLFFRWLLFKTFAKSFKAHTWYWLYTSAQVVLVVGGSMIIGWLLTKNISFLVENRYYFIAISVFPSAYHIWASKEFYGIKLWTSIVRNILTFMLGGISLYLTIAIVYLIGSGLGLNF